MERRWLTPGLRLNGSNDLEAKSPREVRPGRVMSDESPIGKACDPITQILSKLVQLQKVGGLIGSILRRMGRINLNERFRDMPHHARSILRIHPHVRIPSFILFAGMS